MLRILTVIGARPQFIKAAVLSRLIRTEAYRDRISEYLVHTGQHYDENMSEVFFRDMAIPAPDLNLAIGSGGHGKMTGAMLASLEETILAQKPDIVLVYGDTNSTLAGALAAAKLLVPVAHVEAGLRSFMMSMPEEQNRIIADRLSAYLFCPTLTAVDNLKNEGIDSFARSTRAAPRRPRAPSADDKLVRMVGDIMLDASLYYRKRGADAIEKFMTSLPERFYLLTMHRAENTDDPARLAAIVGAVNARPDKTAVCPLHPRTKKALVRAGLSFGEHVRLIDPVGYFEMLALEAACELVVTDSGGVQKEAYFFQKPCVTLRDSTEWVELVGAGWNTLVGADREKILAAFDAVGSPVERAALYGDGRAAEKICDTLLEWA